MTLLCYLCNMEHLHPLQSNQEAPPRFTYPFCYEPHPLCRAAAAQVQQYIAANADIREDADRGKMFGVLVVEGDGAHQAQGDCGTHRPYGFLAAYSGLLAGRNDWSYFVPPVYDAQQPDGHFKTTEREISGLVRGNGSGQPSAADEQQARRMSQELQEWLFHQYQMLNAQGGVKDLVDIWQDYYAKPKLRRRFPLPPGGTGDCCAPKLLQYAYQQGLKPLCMAEFWWGATTKTELRHHLNYYPACRGKCKPILTWMLQGLDVDPDPETLGFEHLDIPIVYEDDYLLVVDKPSGVLSTPGRIEEYSVEKVMQQRYPGSLIGHRLDMGTSGLLVVCKSLETYRPLQEQFIRHEVRKKYIALLERPDAAHAPLPMKGTISLPLRPDPMNRPRQVVDPEHGKRAVTDYELMGDAGTRCLVALYPHTGRTHQLRIHCAHPDGLGRPIVGDELYGTPAASRLMLHAAEIWLRHPVTGADLHFVSPLPFVFP